MKKVAWVHLQNNRLLFAKTRGRSGFYLPGGKLDGDENEHSAVVREIREELGIELTHETLVRLGVFVTPAADRREGTIVELVCFTSDFIGTITPNSEISEIAYLSKSDLRNHHDGERLLSWINTQIYETKRVSLPKFIELETSRKCNRRCSWCPNGKSSSRTVQDIMPWELFKKIISDLESHGYSGWLAFHNYNEPLLNPRLDDEVGFASTKLPNSTIAIFTNGDHLTRSRLESLVSRGATHIRVTLYPSSIDSTFDPQHAIAKAQEWMKRRNIDHSKFVFAPTRQGYAASAFIQKCEINIICPDLSTYHSRGGTAPSLRKGARLSPCGMTSRSAAIDYLGNFKMCCNIYADDPSHSGYILGNLSGTSFLGIWNSDRMRELRSRHSSSDWSITPVCKTCHHYLPDDTLHQ